MTTVAAEPEDGQAPNLSLVVVTHNSRNVLAPLLGVLSSGQAEYFREIVFVDNSSMDGAPEFIRERLPQAKVRVNEINRGFATGVNQGVHDTSARLILLANPDVSWEGRVLESLEQFLESHPRAAAVCPRLVFPDGRPQSSARRFPTHANIWLSRQSPLRFLRVLIPQEFRYTQPDPVKPSMVEAVAATFMLIRRDAFELVGGMDEGYFLYVEDTDLCKRWHDAGWEVWLDPSTAVIHDWKKGSGRAARLRRFHRAGIRRYFQVHHPDKRLQNLFLLALTRLFDGWDRLTRSEAREVNS